MSHWTNVYITKGQFTGEIELPSNLLDSLQATIEIVSDDVMLSLLGYEMYEEFKVAIADEDEEKHQSCLDLINGKFYTNLNSKKVNFEGILKALRYFIYYEYVKSDFKRTFSGAKNTETDNSSKTDLAQQNNYNNIIYNKGVAIYANALFFLNAYSDFNGFKYSTKKIINQINY